MRNLKSKILKSLLTILLLTILGFVIYRIINFIVEYKPPEDIYYTTEIEAIKDGKEKDLEIEDIIYQFTDRDSRSILYKVKDGVSFASFIIKQNGGENTYSCINYEIYSVKELDKICNYNNKKFVSFLNSNSFKYTAEKLKRNELYYFSKDESVYKINNKVPIKSLSFEADNSVYYFHYYYDLEKINNKYDINE